MPWKLYQPKRQRGASGIHWPWKNTEYSQHHGRKEKVGEVALWYCGCTMFCQYPYWLIALFDSVLLFHAIIAYTQGILHAFCRSLSLLHLWQHHLHLSGTPRRFCDLQNQVIQAAYSRHFRVFLDPLRIKPTGRISPPVRRRQIGNHWCRKGVVPRFLNGRKSCHAFQQSPRAAVRESKFINWISPCCFFPVMLEFFGRFFLQLRMLDKLRCHQEQADVLEWRAHGLTLLFR